MKLTIIFDNFGPYHLARVGAAAGLMEITGVELRGRSRTYAWNPAGEVSFRRLTLPDAVEGGRGGRMELAGHLERALDESRPEVVAVNGWGDFLAPQSIRWCVRRKVPVVMMSESTAMDGPRQAVREMMKRRLVGLASTALVGGKPHREYVRELGLRDEDVFNGYNAVDNDYFAGASQRVRGAEGREVRPYFLASNRFIGRKNLEMLVDGYAEYAGSAGGGRDGGAWGMCLLGDGELRGELTVRCERRGLEVREAAPWEEGERGQMPGEGVVYFPGFRQVEELPRFYAHAGCFVHPAVTEPWGLVVNESMASGLPVLVSRGVGCASDLVVEGENGYGFDPRDAGKLAGLMGRVAGKGEGELAAMGEASRRIIAEWGPDRFARGLKAAAERAVEVGPKRAGVVDMMLLEGLCRR